MTEEPGIDLHVRFVPDADAEADDALSAITANRFFHVEIEPGTFIVTTPSPHYGGVRSLTEDLNENARHGRYEVRELTDSEREAFARSGELPHL